MEVITMEHAAFKRLEDMFVQAQEVIQEQAKKLSRNETIWLDVSEVAELTRYHEKTIKLRKAEIGYRTMGKDIFFKLKDVEAWTNKYYRAPRIIRP